MLDLRIIINNRSTLIKIFSLVLIITAINLIIVIPKPDGANWESIAEHPKKKETVYYDKESVVKHSKSLIRVWVKTEFKKEDEKFKDHTLSLFELNCKLREWRILKSITYLKEGWHEESEPDKNYYESTAYPSKWESLAPVDSSMISILYKNICP